MTYREAMREARRAYLVDLLARHDGCISRAAREAKIDRTALYRLLQRHGIARERPIGKERGAVLTLRAHIRPPVQVRRSA